MAIPPTITIIDGYADAMRW